MEQSSHYHLFCCSDCSTVQTQDVEGPLASEAGVCFLCNTGELVCDFSLQLVAATNAAPLPLASFAVMNFTSAAGAKILRYSCTQTHSHSLKPSTKTNKETYGDVISEFLEVVVEASVTDDGQLVFADLFDDGCQPDGCKFTGSLRHCFAQLLHGDTILSERHKRFQYQNRQCSLDKQRTWTREECRGRNGGGNEFSPD